MSRLAPRHELRIVGYDPGPTRVAFAELEVSWPQRPNWVRHGILGTKETPCTSEMLRRHVHELAPGTIIAIEKPSGYIHEHARGAQLLETANVAGQIKAFALDTFHAVFEFSAEQWRRHVCSNGHASNEQIASTLRVLIAGVPVSNNHHRDAAGIALAVGMLQKRIDQKTANPDSLSAVLDGNGNNQTARAGCGRRRRAG